MHGDALALKCVMPSWILSGNYICQNVQLFVRLNLGVSVVVFCSDKISALVYFVSNMYEKNETLR